jgi:hypothetical protein
MLRGSGQRHDPGRLRPTEGDRHVVEPQLARDLRLRSRARPGRRAHGRGREAEPTAPLCPGASSFRCPRVGSAGTGARTPCVTFGRRTMPSVTRKAQSYTSRPACPAPQPAPQRGGEAARRRRVPSGSCRVERLKPACRGRRPTSTRGQGRVAAACFLETFRATQGRRARLAQAACGSQPGRHAGGARPPGGHVTGRPPCSCRPSSAPPGSTPVRQLVASTMHRNIRPPAHAHRERPSGRHRQPRNGAPAETAAWLTWMAERGLHQSGRDATDGGTSA